MICIFDIAMHLKVTCLAIMSLVTLFTVLNTLNDDTGRRSY